MLSSCKILVLPALLTFAVVVTSLMGLTSCLSRRSLETTFVVSSMRQGRPCSLCHDGSFARSSLRIASLPCEARPAD